MALIDQSSPLAEPIDLSYAKSFLRVDGNEEDALIQELIKASRHQVENILGRTLVRRSFIYRGDVPKGTCLSLPRPPLLDVIRLSLISDDNTSADIPPDDYLTNTRREPGELRLRDGARWDDYLERPQTVEIEFDAGYGDSADDVPLPIKQAVVLLLAQSFEHRDNGEQMPAPMMVDALLMPYRWVRL